MEIDLQRIIDERDRQLAQLERQYADLRLVTDAYREYVTTLKEQLHGKGDKTCYQCEGKCRYLFADARCKDCTRLTIEEVRGD